MQENSRNVKNLKNTHNATSWNNCALALHAFDNFPTFDFDNPTIIDIKFNSEKRIIIEMLHIKTIPNCVNHRTDIENLNSLYNLILIS